ncbi:VWA domain-containing protein [Paenibacillus sp. GCM10012307]|uniref:VWA domain-containing protein n=1 Tax=Paenibacillus roseus TaxID=2798579 RepID=A0A934MR59_9BACL|nr:VWA domain-containing protein [Paenibacillus roseus]MBJ6363911.1 VWA domain-containing protein [Paenibacillus roseus]
MKRSVASRLMVFVMFILVVTGCSSSSNSISTAPSPKAGDNASANHSITSASEALSNRSSEPVEKKELKQSNKVTGGQAGPEPKAGQLTAGEWDDALKWGDWLNQLNGHDGSEAIQLWGMYPLQRIVVEVTAGRRSVPDVWLTVKNKNGETVWEARTDMQGKAYAYPLLFDAPKWRKSKGDYQIEVRSGGQIVAHVEHVNFSESEPLKIDIGSQPDISELVDVMLVVDTTGSMGDELQYLTAELKDVVTQAVERSKDKLTMRISANFYRDHYDEYLVRSFPFTKDVDEVIRQLAAQTAQGGGDYPEAVDEALRNALYEHEWSENARARLLFLVLDAPPHDDKQSLTRMRELTQEAARMGVRIIPVASSGINKDTEYLLRTLAVTTGGSYIFLTDDSGIGNEHIKPDVGQYDVKLLNELLVEVILRYTQQQ